MAVVEKTVDIIGDEAFSDMILAKAVPENYPAVSEIYKCDEGGQLCSCKLCFAQIHRDGKMHTSRG